MNKKNKDLKDVALFDMDGTLCDHDLGLFRELEKLRGPQEKQFKSLHNEKVPDHIKRRADLIRKKEEFWVNLPRFKLGWDVLKIAKKVGFKIMILTQGPRTKPSGWSGKMKWIMKNLPNTDVTITRDKGLVYGKILVDDYPEYIKRWLEHRPRGLVIMPANKGNKDFKYENVIRYDGTNIGEIKKALLKVKKRKANEPLEL